MIYKDLSKHNSLFLAKKMNGMNTSIRVKVLNVFRL